VDKEEEPTNGKTSRVVMGKVFHGHRSHSADATWEYRADVSPWESSKLWEFGVK